MNLALHAEVGADPERPPGERGVPAKNYYSSRVRRSHFSEFVQARPAKQFGKGRANGISGRLNQARSCHGIEGVTFLSGEPILQARGLARIARLIRPLGLSVMLFTGYRLEDLPQMRLPGCITR